jgi:hypothetical protein
MPDQTVAMRGFERHTYVCSSCHSIERKVVFTRHGREDEGVPLPVVPVVPVVRQVSVHEEHAAAQGLLGRVVAQLRGGN